jgi:hypothetical protein
VNYRSLFSDLQYRGLVRSAKRNYHIAEGVNHYVLFSPGKGTGTGGNFTVVAREAVDYLVRRLGGKRAVTSADALAACKRSKFLNGRFEVLNALYVLVGTKRARISKMVGQTLYFDVRKHAG